MKENITGQILPSSTDQASETIDKTQEALEKILSAINDQTKHLSTVAEHLIKLQLQNVAQDVVEEPELLAEEALNVGEQTGQAGISALQVPPDVVQDVLEDTDKGLKEIKPRKKSLFKGK